MALPSIRLRSQTADHQRPTSTRSNGPSKRVDLTIVTKGFQAIFNGINDVGKGVYKFGKDLEDMGKQKDENDANNFRMANETLLAHGVEIDPGWTEEQLYQKAEEVAGFRPIPTYFR